MPEIQQNGLNNLKRNKMKQETLEEAAERLYPINSTGGSMEMLSRYQLNNNLKQEGFIKGANYQAERMYSEEDMKDYALKCISNYLFGNDFISDNLRIPIVENNNKQFEKFKNK